MISLSTVAFPCNPEQFAMIKADPGKTLNAVEEMLRYFTIIDVSTVRLCVEDIEVGGQLIRAGDGVLAIGYSANRDLRAFGTLFGRVPTLEPAMDIDEPPFKDDANIYGLYQLPVTW